MYALITLQAGFHGLPVVNRGEYQKIDLMRARLDAYKIYRNYDKKQQRAFFFGMLLEWNDVSEKESWRRKAATLG